MTVVATYKSFEVIRINHSDLPEPLHRVVENLVDISIRQRPRAHLEAVVEGGVKNVDHCVGVHVRAQKSILNSLLKIGDGHFASWHRPSVTQFSGEPGIELSLGKQRSDKNPVLAAED